MINEDDRALKLLDSLSKFLVENERNSQLLKKSNAENDIWSKHSAHNDNGDNSKWQTNFLSGIRYLNHSVMLLRKCIVDLVLNHTLDGIDFDNPRLKLSQRYLQKTIELLQEDIIQVNNTFADSKNRYHSSKYLSG